MVIFTLLGGPATVVTVALSPEIDDVPIVALTFVESPAVLLGVKVVVALPAESVVPEVGDKVPA
jgi:hypothetical protein